MTMKDTRTRSTRPALGRRDFFKLGVGGGAMVAAGLVARTTGAQTNGWDLESTGKPISIDMHSHWVPESYARALSDMYGRTEAVPLAETLKTRIERMDKTGVQMLVLTLSGGQPWSWTSPEAGARLASACNDDAIKAYTAFPDRFMGSVEMYVPDPKLSLQELNRVAGKPGIRSVHLPPSLDGTRDYVFEPSFEPVLARCEELGYPLLFHPLDLSVNYYDGPDTRFADPDSRYIRFDNTLGFPMETATTAAKFIASGTLDKFPKLETLLPHAGGSFPYLAGRVEQGLAASKVRLKRPFKEYIRRFHYDTMTYYPETLRFLIDLVGADRVVVGTDNSYGRRNNFEYPNAIVEHLNLPAADREKILRGNAARLLRLSS
jgi:aminocarboxymuconate-semialdehyde decarboxylase